MYPIVFVKAGGQYEKLSFTDRLWLNLISEENSVCFLILRELFRNHRASNDFNKQLANETTTVDLWDKQFEPVTKEQVRKYFRHLIDKGQISYDYDKSDDSLKIAIQGKGIIAAVSNQYLVDGKKDFLDKTKTWLQILVFIGTLYTLIHTNLVQMYDLKQVRQELKQIKQGQDFSSERLQQIELTLPQVEKSVLTLEKKVYNEKDSL